MRRTFLALALSAFTLVGGHFVNRRWDRAVLVFVAVAVWAAGVYFSFMRRFWSVAQDTNTDYAADFLSHWTALGIGVLVLWAASLFFTYWDSRRALSVAIPGWAGTVSAVGLSLLTAAFLLPFALSFFATYSMNRTSEPASTKGSEPVFSRFTSYYYFGGFPSSMRELPKPPSGPAYLRIRFIWDEKLAAGIKFIVALNGKFETETVTTDSNGEASIRVPAGEWHINRLGIQSWGERGGTDRHMVLTGQEPHLTSGETAPYFEIHQIPQDGIRVIASEKPSEAFTFTLRPHLAITWPSNEKAPEPVVAWEAFPNAETYLVEVTEIKREGTTISFSSIGTRRVKNVTELPISRLTAVPNEGRDVKEYQVSVAAFDTEGRLLTKSEHDFGARYSFKLADKQLVSDVDVRSAGRRASQDDFQQILENNRRIEAIEVLLKDGLVAEAERLLPKVKGKVDPGKKKAIRGYVLASRGRCAEANRLFDQALSEGGSRCLPNYYRAGCTK